MPLSLVLIVFVNSSEIQAPTTLALRSAAQEVLGSDSEVQVRGYTTIPDDEALTNAARGADAVAEVSWQDSARRRALVHCYVDGWHRFVNRELVFDDRDEVRERGRMLGFAIASMLSAAESNDPPREAPPARGERLEIESRPLKPARPQPEVSGSEDAGPRLLRAGRVTGAIDISALGMTGANHSGLDLGVGMAGRWYFYRSLSLRLGAGVRYGDIEPAQVRSSLFFGALGLGFQFTSPDPNSRFVFGGRADALLTVNTLRRTPADQAIPESQTRVQPAADLLLEGGWYFLSNTALLAAVGGEFGLGHADVVVRGTEVADIPALRGVLELGIRARF